MSETEISALDGISPPFLFEIELDHDQPIAMGGLGILFASLNRAVEVWSANYFENYKESQFALHEAGRSGRDARLSLALYDAHHSKWKFLTAFVGKAAISIIGGVIANNADRIFQDLGLDLSKTVTAVRDVDTAQTKELPPFQEACKRAIDAAVKLNANSVVCRVKEGDRVLQEIEILRAEPKTEPSTHAR